MAAGAREADAMLGVRIAGESQEEHEHEHKQDSASGDVC